MSDHWKRPEPERTAPKRRSTGSTDHARNGASAPSSGPSGFGPVGDAVTRGVQLGYQVIEEQIRLGQRMAEQLGGTLGPGAMPGGSGQMPEQMMRMYLALASQWLQMAAPLLAGAPAGMPFWPGGTRGAAEPQNSWFDHGGTDRTAPPGSPARPSPAPVRVAVDLKSDGGVVEVHLDIEEGAAAAHLATPPLRSLDGEGVLSDVRFRPAAPGGAPTFEIRVPADQPPATYYGTVVDRDTDAVVGTVRVMVSEQ